MPIELNEVNRLLESLSKAIEDFWIERESFRVLLEEHEVPIPKGFIEDMLSDPKFQQAARDKFSSPILVPLKKAIVAAVIEESIRRGIPPPDEVN